jgi:hypothetical protein
MANAMLSMMHKLGMDDVTSFGDSTDAFSLDYSDGMAEAPSKG